MYSVMLHMYDLHHFVSLLSHTEDSRSITFVLEQKYMVKLALMYGYFLFYGLASLAHPERHDIRVAIKGHTCS